MRPHGRFAHCSCCIFTLAVRKTPVWPPVSKYTIVIHSNIIDVSHYSSKITDRETGTYYVGAWNGRQKLQNGPHFFLADAWSFFSCGDQTFFLNLDCELNSVKCLIIGTLVTVHGNGRVSYCAPQCQLGATDEATTTFSVVKPKNDQAPTKKSAVRFAVFAVRLMPQRTCPFFRFYPQKQQ